MNGFLSIRGASASGMTMVGRDGGDERSTVSQLVFHRFGDRYFLREVWTRWDSARFLCPKSKAEGQAERAQRAVDRASNAATTNIEFALLEGPR
jgi:hypothetical protein